MFGRGYLQLAGANRSKHPKLVEAPLSKDRLRAKKIADLLRDA
jgi:hypothetical protein